MTPLLNTVPLTINDLLHPEQETQLLPGLTAQQMPEHKVQLHYHDRYLEFSSIMTHTEADKPGYWDSRSIARLPSSGQTEYQRHPSRDDDFLTALVKVVRDFHQAARTAKHPDHKREFIILAEQPRIYRDRLTTTALPAGASPPTTEDFARATAVALDELLDQAATSPVLHNQLVYQFQFYFDTDNHPCAYATAHPEEHQGAPEEDGPGNRPGDITLARSRLTITPATPPAVEKLRNGLLHWTTGSRGK